MSKRTKSVAEALIEPTAVEPGGALPVTFNYEPMKPLAAKDAAKIAVAARNSSIEYDQSADASEKAASLLLIKAGNFRKIAVELRKLRR